jgi:hypothetical protein
VNSIVTVTGSNFPQNVKKDETVAMLNNKGAIVLQFEHTVSCLPSAYDCNRTQIVLQLPEVISPSAVKLVLSNRGQNLRVRDLHSATNKWQRRRAQLLIP